jgi:AcrR family transcriptional regulator
MKEKTRRSNEERSETTRAALIAAARRLFVEKSYAATGTPELVADAKVTRGALYHHFADKRALFRAVVEAESEAIAAEIEAAAPGDMPSFDGLIQGGEAFLAAMRAPGRTRLLLIDAPAVLGREEVDAIDARHAIRTLREGLTAAMADGAIRRLPLNAITVLLASAYDRAALAIEAGAAPEDWRLTIRAVIEGLRPSPAR